MTSSILELAMPYLDKIDGFGLDSSEIGHPPEKFEQLFARCRALGKKITAHAGEEGPSEYVISALDRLKVDRIDHGNRSLEDMDLVKRLANSKMTLTVCPLSNHKLCVVKDLTQHPLKQMLESGLNVTINSDDPSYFGGYVNDNYIAMIEHLDINATDIYQLAVNSIHSAWLDPLSKQKHLNAIKQSYQDFLSRS